MTQYRIVQRAPFCAPDEQWFFAQFKFLNLIWMDCQFQWDTEAGSSSENMYRVEKFIEKKIQENELGITRYLNCFKQTVVKKYKS